MHLSHTISRLSVHDSAAAKRKAKPIADFNISIFFPKHKHECAEDICSFFDYRESLTIIDGMVMKEKRIVIPESLRNDALKVLHKSHMGIVETKECASTSMFWPKIYSNIENYLSTCCLCMMCKVKQ